MNPFEHTERISFELSNRCVYSTQHRNCPLHLNAEVKHLPMEVVSQVFESLETYGFSGVIAFHNYNEPLIDPRLFLFLEWAKMMCPKALTYILTNGFMLDQVMLNELVSAGVKRIFVSAYTDVEYERMRRLFIPKDLSFSMQRLRGLDDRLEIYDRDPLEVASHCRAPLRSLVINHDATVGLCCYDWKREHKIGDLTLEPIYRILNYPSVRELYESFRRGERNLPICKRCRSGGK